MAELFNAVYKRLSIKANPAVYTFPEQSIFWDDFDPEIETRWIPLAGLLAVEFCWTNLAAGILGWRYAVNEVGASTKAA